MHLFTINPLSDLTWLSELFKLIVSEGVGKVELCLDATVAQLVEQLICNQLVGGSIPLGGSTGFRCMPVASGIWQEGYPSGQRGRAVNPLA